MNHPSPTYAATMRAAAAAAESADPELAALGRATRDISSAFMTWFRNEEAAGSSAKVRAAALNTVIAHALAGFVDCTTRQPGCTEEDCIEFHLASIGRLALKRLAEHQAEQQQEVQRQ